MPLNLLATLIAPTLLVSVGLVWLHDVRWAFFLYVFGACGAVPWLLLRATPLRQGIGLPFRRPGLRAAIAFLLFGPGFLGLYSLFRAQLTAPEPYLESLVRLGWPTQHSTLALVLFATLVPLFEEWWWRGQALPRCVARFGTRAGVLVAASGFASYHLVVLWQLYTPGLALLRFTGIFLGGLMWTVWAHRRGSWEETWAAHFGADLALVAAFVLWVLPSGGAS